MSPRFFVLQEGDTGELTRRRRLGNEKVIHLYRTLLVWVSVCGIFDGDGDRSGYAYPKITQQIVDDVIIGGKLELLTKLLVGIVIVGIGRSIFGYCKEFTFDVLASKIGSAMRKDLFDHIQSLSMGYFEDTNTGELMARVKDDVDKIWNAMGYVGMLVIEVSFMCPWYCTACFRSTGSWRSCRLPQ